MAPQWPPGGADLTAKIEKGQVKLSWKPALPGAAPLAGYNIYRAEDDSPARVTAAVKSTKHTDRVVLGRLRSPYYVRGPDAAGRATPPSATTRVAMPLPALPAIRPAQLPP